MYSIKAGDYGAVFDGMTDDSAALQAAIDYAAQYGGVVELPHGTAVLHTPLDLTARYVTIKGAGMLQTRLVAGAPMTCVLDAGDASDASVSPLVLDGFTIDGNKIDTVNKAAAGIIVRYRHNSVFSNLLVVNAATGVQEKDTWLSRRYNCRVESCDTGWHLQGSNHSSVFTGCSFNGASSTHLLIESQGSANDGNDAITFQSCDVEFSNPNPLAPNVKGIVIASGVTVRFVGCYLGENIPGVVMTNSGHVEIDGGVVFFGFGHEDAVGGQAAVIGTRAFQLTGGQVTVSGTGLYAQAAGAGFANLVKTDTADIGRIKFSDMRAAFPVGGDQTIDGDPLDYGPAASVFAPRLGRLFQPVFFNATGTSATGAGNDTNARTVTYTASTGAGPIIGLNATLASTAWRQGEPLYLVLVYEATLPLDVRLSAGAFGVSPTVSLGAPPATSGGKKTYVKVDVPATGSAVTTLEILMPLGIATAGSLTVYEAFLADSSIVDAFDPSDGTLRNLFKC